ncbi:MAG: hypothetical protein K1X57_01950 [Gemmataceae bacterium]|nr:hypothetical protein [Gemmataceae bacterium]
MNDRGHFLLGLCIIVAASLVAFVPRPQSPVPPVGRYQMSGVPGHAYVIDTVTGQVWEDFASSGQGSSDSDFKKPKLK